MYIRLFAMDVDGTMTDGKIYMGPAGEVMKAFHVKDGQGIALLHSKGVITAILTARQSEIVRRRAQELHIDEVCQSVLNKGQALQALCEKYGISPEETAYTGDDTGDLSALAFAGVSMCPSDAVPAVKQAVNVVLPSKGGDGAVRDAAEWILSAG